MSWFFYKLRKGSTPTFLTASFANKIIHCINTLGNIKIKGGKQDQVYYSNSGVVIEYASGGNLNKTLRLLDPANLQQVNINIEKGVVKKVTTSASGLKWKNITVCEGGSPTTYTFLTK